MSANDKAVDLAGINEIFGGFGYGEDARKFFAVAIIKFAQPFATVAFTTSDFVEFFFDDGSELVVDDAGKVLREQPHNGKRCPARHECLTLLPHVAAVHDDLQDVCVRRWPTDAKLFEFFHQRWFGVSRWWRRGVTNSREFGYRNLVAHLEYGQNRFGVVITFVFVDFFVDRAVSRKRDGGAAGAELAVGCVVAGTACFGAETQSQCGAAGVTHL